MSKNIIGIDPGFKGGIVLLNSEGELLEKWVMPIIGSDRNKAKREIDFSELRTIFQQLSELKGSCHCFIEKVHAMPKQGVSSMFKMGLACGAIEAMVAAFNIPYSKITPQSWNKAMHEGLNKEIKTKDRSLIVYKRAYSGVDLFNGPRSGKPHEGVLDALLIAEHGRRILNSN